MVLGGFEKGGDRIRRPYVILNAAMTLDGKISSKRGDSLISCDEDLDRVHQLRSDVDGVMVGIGTVLADDPVLTVRRVEGENPVRVVVDSKARTPPDSRVLNASAQTIILVAEASREEDRERLSSLGAQVIVSGDEKVDLRSSLEHLAEQGIEKILLEGGATLNWAMLSQGLVDEVRIAIRPCIVGGEEAKTLAEGPGVEKITDGVELSIIEAEQVDRDLLLIYKVGESSSD